ncbi:hypothetical protein PUN28_020793 [Cardiocondyla obscurior]|uniref:Uncharacterized protein n=1 Tax=Cardiocondyla obscurior TaxID=286306 RepID=A0AAW2E598_9HYME
MSNKLDPGFVKADSTNLSSRESYGDSAIGYVSVKREGPICVVKGKICPEHKVRKKNCFSQDRKRKLSQN